MTAGLSNVQLARTVAEAVRGVAGVVDLDAGAVGEFATYGGGDRVRGVRARVPREGGEARVAVRLVVRFGYPLPELTDRLRATVRDVVERLTGVADATVDLHVVDVRDTADAGELPAATSPATPPVPHPPAPGPGGGS